MTMGKAFWLALAYTVLSQSLLGQNQSTDTTAHPGILKEYDQAIDHVAERAMQSVVEIEVTGYGVPEKDQDQGQQALERQRTIGSGVTEGSPLYPTAAELSFPLRTNGGCDWRA